MTDLLELAVRVRDLNDRFLDGKIAREDWMLLLAPVLAEIERRGKTLDDVRLLLEGGAR